MTEHGVPALVGPGSADVEVGDKQAWRTMLDVCNCSVSTPGPHGEERCYVGSTTVLINDKMACRRSDMLQGAGPVNYFDEGDESVIIGDDGIGMARDQASERYAMAMRRIYENWDDMTPEERRAAMEQALNDSLPEGMPRLELLFKDLEDGTFGQFDNNEWQAEINDDYLEGEMTEDRFSEMTNTIYHEGRHGEQDYHSAQFRAGQGHGADAISADMGIPQHVAEAAGDDPAYPGSSEAALGEPMYDSLYGSRAQHRHDVVSYPDAGTHGTEANQSYRGLPEEQDAFRQGDIAESMFWAF